MPFQPFTVERKAMQTPRKDNSVKIRFDAPTLSLLEKAGSLTGMDRSKFVRFSVRSIATEIIAQHEKTVFGEGDWRTFFNMLSQSNQEPSPRVKKAADRYQHITHE